MKNLSLSVLTENRSWRTYMPLVPAMRKMRYWIQRNPELYEAMYRSGEARGDHRYTRRQVRLIVETLGEP